VGGGRYQIIKDDGLISCILYLADSNKMSLSSFFKSVYETDFLFGHILAIQVCLLSIYELNTYFEGVEVNPVKYTSLLVDQLTTYEPF